MPKKLRKRRKLRKKSVVAPAAEATVLAPAAEAAEAKAPVAKKTLPKKRPAAEADSDGVEQPKKKGKGEDRRWDSLLKELPDAAQPPSTFVHTRDSYVVKFDFGRIGVWLRRESFYVYDVKVDDVTEISSTLKKNKNNGMNVNFGEHISDAFDHALHGASGIPNPATLNATDED